MRIGGLKTPMLVIIAATALSLVGCQMSSARGSERKVVLRIADWGGASDDTEFSRTIREVYEKFEREHPHIKLKIEHIPGSQEYVFKLLTQFVAGTAPDIISLDASSAAVFINNNVLRDLSPYIAADLTFDENAFFPNVYSIATRDKKIYGLPGNFTPMMVYYNKHLFDEAGVAYPRDGWTWEEFLDACLRLTKTRPGETSPYQYGFYFTNWMPGWIMWLWQNGADVLSPDGTRANGFLNSPEAVEAVQFFTDLVIKHKVAPTISETAATGSNLFQSGQAAMEISGHWSMVGYKASESKTFKFSDIGVIGLPQRKHRVTVMYHAGLSITVNSKHPKEAWEFIRYGTGAEVQAKMASSGLAVAGVRSVAEKRAAADKLEPVFVREIKYARAPWGARVEGYAYVEDVGKMAVDEVLLGGVPVKQALDRAARKIDEKLTSILTK